MEVKQTQAASSPPSDKRPLIVTILCGGAGSRLWPASREIHPKPFIRLADGQSLLQKTFIRGSSIPDVTKILAVTNRELFFKTEEDFFAVRQPNQAISFILEPFGRNTAAAIATAALHVRELYGDDACMLVLPADHLISEQSAFEKAVLQAIELALNKKLVTFGIRPTKPETGYGYIEADGTSVLRFVEKPQEEKAREYVQSGRYLWNSGMFCFTASAILQQLEKHCPQILASTKACLHASEIINNAGTSKIELNAQLFEQVPEDSIDYAVMEKSAEVAVVPCNIGWSDIGSWTALGELDEMDQYGNRIQGEAVVQDTRNCMIHAGDRLVATVGVDDLVIVETSDAVLVAHKDKTQDVKSIYNKLKELGHQAYCSHRQVHRPWGSYTVLEEGLGFKIKRIEVKPGASLSLQMHHYRSEHWVVVAGAAQVINGDHTIEVAVNESTFIPAGHKHRLHNPGTTTCIIIEVQTGHYLGEDDIVRFEDKYGRAF